MADLERQVRASDQARVQMQQQLDMMNQDLNSLIGRLEETNNAMADLQKNQQELFKQISDLTARMNQLQSGAITQSKMITILNGSQPGKAPSSKLTFTEKKLREYFPSQYTTAQMRGVIESLLSDWKNTQGSLADEIDQNMGEEW